MKKRVVLLAGLLLCFFHSVFGQVQLIQNGGFENTTPPPWQFAGVGEQVYLSGAQSGIFAHSGNYYLSMGNVNGANQRFYQTITFPTNLIAATLNFYYDVVTTDANPGADVLYVYFTDTNNSIVLTNVGQVSNSSATVGYNQATFNLVSYNGTTNLSPYAGRSVNLVFGVTTDPTFGSLTTFAIDDVSMVVATPANIPANDEFTNAIPLVGVSNVVAANNTYASKETGETNIAGNAGGHSLWWRWTAPAIGTVTLKTTGSSFITLLGVYTGSSVTNLTQVAANNGNSRNSGWAQVTFNATAGTQYQIAVDGFNGQFGSVDLGLNFVLDTTPPKVTISSPASGAKVTNSTVQVKGTASDNVSVATVEYRLENASGTNDYQIATGTNSWSGTVTNLMPGANTVRAFALDTSSNASPTVTRTFTYIVVSPLTLTTNGNGTVSGASNGQLLNVGGTYKITAKPGTGSVFNGWTGDIIASSATLTFIMQSNMMLQANFVPNPFGPVVGTYQGLFYDTNDVIPQSSGFFSATLSSSGAMSAKLQSAGASYSLSGQFLGSGAFSNSIPRKNSTPLSVQLQLDLAGGNKITGLVSNAGWTAELLANRNIYSKTSAPPQMGKYTLLIPGNADSSTQPGGDSFSTVSVDSLGNVTLSGTLGDATKLSEKTILSAQGQWPLYAAPYSGTGLVLGWLTFTNELTNDIDGLVTWIKPAQATKLYPGGFTNQTDAMGSIYRFTNNVPVLNMNTGQVTLVNGNLAASITNQAVLATNNKVTGTNKLSLTITTSSGLFKGSVPDPATGKTISFSGVLLQKQNFGSGLFSGTNQTGRAFFGP